MLSHRQIWRKQKSIGINRGKEHFLQYQQNICSCFDLKLAFFYTDLHLKNNDSFKPTAHIKDNNNHNTDHLSIISSKLIKPYHKQLNNNHSIKKVKFNATVSVILIPTVNDYKKVHLETLLWWKQDDYNTFKKEALFELKLLIKNNQQLDYKTAAKILYQSTEYITLHNKDMHEKINNII